MPAPKSIAFRTIAFVSHAVLVPLAFLLLAGCGGSGNGPSLASPTAPPAPPPYSPAANLSGAWAGSYTSLADGVDQLTDSTYPATAAIEQADSRVSALLGTGAGPEGYTFTGFLDGLRLFGTINGMRASGELEGDRLTILWGYNRWDLQR